MNAEPAGVVLHDGVEYVSANEATLLIALATRWSGGGAYRRLVQAWDSGEVRGLALSKVQRWFALVDVRALAERLSGNEPTDASDA